MFADSDEKAAAYAALPRPAVTVPLTSRRFAMNNGTDLEMGSKMCVSNIRLVFHLVDVFRMFLPLVQLHQSSLVGGSPWSDL